MNQDLLINQSNKNKVALITGGSRGLGRGVAIELAKIGWNVVINYRQNESAAQETLSLITKLASASGNNIRAIACKADISKKEDRFKLLDFTKTEFGRLDMLVNNAGVAPQKRVDILELDEDNFDHVLNSNLKGAFFLSQLAAKLMIEQQSQETSQNSHPTKSPKIVFITSISSYTASINRAEYCIAKAGLSMATKLFASRLAKHGIQVFEIRPGIMDTDMTKPVHDRYDPLIKSGLIPMARWGTPEDIGKTMVAIANDCFPFSTGEIINIDGGFHIRTL